MELVCPNLISNSQVDQLMEIQYLTENTTRENVKKNWHVNNMKIQKNIEKYNIYGKIDIIILKKYVFINIHYHSPKTKLK